jgi:hypothetical protein
MLFMPNETQTQNNTTLSVETYVHINVLCKGKCTTNKQSGLFYEEGKLGCGEDGQKVF